MNTEYSAVTKQDGGWWIGWIVEVPGVNCQERTHEELLDSLRITLQEALEFNREEALKAAGENYREEKIAVRSEADSCATCGKTAASCFAKVHAIPSGTTRPRTSAPRFPGTPKSVTSWRSKSAGSRRATREIGLIPGVGPGNLLDFYSSTFQKFGVIHGGRNPGEVLKQRLLR